MNSECFRQYGREFQEKIFQAFMTDRRWASQMIEVMTPDFFEIKYLKYLTEKYFSFYSQYKDFPTMPLLITIVRDDLSEGNDVILRDQVVEYLHRIRMNPDMGDIGYVKDKSLDFCKKQALRAALEKAVDMIADEKYESVVDLMKNAISLGEPVSTGHDFF